MRFSVIPLAYVSLMVIIVADLTLVASAPIPDRVERSHKPHKAPHEVPFYLKEQNLKIVFPSLAVCLLLLICFLCCTREGGSWCCGMCDIQQQYALNTEEIRSPSSLLIVQQQAMIDAARSGGKLVPLNPLTASASDMELFKFNFTGHTGKVGDVEKKLSTDHQLLQEGEYSPHMPETSDSVHGELSVHQKQQLDEDQAIYGEHPTAQTMADLNPDTAPKSDEVHRHHQEVNDDVDTNQYLDRKKESVPTETQKLPNNIKTFQPEKFISGNESNTVKTPLKHKRKINHTGHHEIPLRRLRPHESIIAPQQTSAFLPSTPFMYQYHQESPYFQLHNPNVQGMAPKVAKHCGNCMIDAATTMTFDEGTQWDGEDMMGPEQDKWCQVNEDHFNSNQLVSVIASPLSNNDKSTQFSEVNITNDSSNTRSSVESRLSKFNDESQFTKGESEICLVGSVEPTKSIQDSEKIDTDTRNGENVMTQNKSNHIMDYESANSVEYAMQTTPKLVRQESKDEFTYEYTYSDTTGEESKQSGTEEIKQSKHVTKDMKNINHAVHKKKRLIKREPSIKSSHPPQRFSYPGKVRISDPKMFDTNTVSSIDLRTQSQTVDALSRRNLSTRSSLGPQDRSRNKSLDSKRRRESRRERLQQIREEMSRIHSQHTDLHRFSVRNRVSAGEEKDERVREPREETFIQMREALERIQAQYIGHEYTSTTEDADEATVEGTSARKAANRKYNPDDMNTIVDHFSRNSETMKKSMHTASFPNQSEEQLQPQTFSFQKDQTSLENQTMVDINRDTIQNEASTSNQQHRHLGKQDTGRNVFTKLFCCLFGSRGKNTETYPTENVQIGQDMPLTNQNMEARVFSSVSMNITEVPIEVHDDPFGSLSSIVIAELSDNNEPRTADVNRSIAPCGQCSEISDVNGKQDPREHTSEVITNEVVRTEKCGSVSQSSCAVNNYHLPRLPCESTVSVPVVKDRQIGNVSSTVNCGTMEAASSAMLGAATSFRHSSTHDCQMTHKLSQVSTTAGDVSNEMCGVMIPRTSSAPGVPLKQDKVEAHEAPTPRTDSMDKGDTRLRSASISHNTQSSMCLETQSRRSTMRPPNDNANVRSLLPSFGFSNFLLPRLRTETFTNTTPPELLEDSFDGAYTGFTLTIEKEPFYFWRKKPDDSTN